MKMSEFAFVALRSHEPAALQRVLCPAGTPNISPGTGMLPSQIDAL
jgi:hypothetical protein